MITIKALIAVGTVAVCGVVMSGVTGCAQPGVIEQHNAAPTKKDAGTKDAKVAKPPVEEDDDTDDTTVPDDADKGEDDAVTDDDTSVPPEDDADEDKPTGSVDAGKKPDAGTGSGSKPDAGGGSKDPAEAPACPSGFTCEDPAAAITARGFDGTVTDEDNKPVPFGCGKGEDVVMCDPMEDVKAACPDLPNPICAHIKIGGLIPADLYVCSQLCSP